VRSGESDVKMSKTSIKNGRRIACMAYRICRPF
jgi:hypothetical protein